MKELLDGIWMHLKLLNKSFEALVKNKESLKSDDRKFIQDCYNKYAFHSNEALKVTRTLETLIKGE